MRIKLVLCNMFESDFQDKHYYIYQFVDPQTLTILQYSSTEDMKLSTEKEYNCVISVKKSKLVVSNVINN